MVYYNIMDKWIMYILGFLLGMLLFYMLKDVCGCKNIVEGAVDEGEEPSSPVSDTSGDTDGAQGATGAQGDIGPSGPAGDTGAQGDNSATPPPQTCDKWEPNLKAACRSLPGIPKSNPEKITCDSDRCKPSECCEAKCVVATAKSRAERGYNFPIPVENHCFFDEANPNQKSFWGFLKDKNYNNIAKINSWCTSFDTKEKCLSHYSDAPASAANAIEDEARPLCCKWEDDDEGGVEFRPFYRKNGGN